MKKILLIALLLFSFSSVISQEKPKDKAKDTVKTEVVEVITTYNPKIADAKKIKRNPTITLSKKSKKQKLKYTIFSAPVASTFIPRSGVVKGIDVGIKERIYNNYLALGYGNFNSPFAELLLHHSTRFKNEFGISSKYNTSLENINNTILNSTFSNFNLNAFYKQEDRYFDWKIDLFSEKNEYNWYGLPNINFNQTTLNSIDEAQAYNYFKLHGNFKFHDSYINYSNIGLAYFTDRFKSKEILANFNAKLTFPLDAFVSGLNDIAIDTDVEFLKGNFKNNYEGSKDINYAILTAKIHPKYQMNFKNFALEAGINIVGSFDTENKANNILLLPNLKFKRAVFKDYIAVYGGFFSDLKTNSYKSLTDQNPFISPTIFITQTLENKNLFLGLNGRITNDLTYNFKYSNSKEEDKPLFLRNNSKSDGSSSIVNGTQLLGYEFGNSFDVFYDDVGTTSLLGELEYILTKNITFNTNIQYNKYEITNALEVWNLPALEANFSAKYKTNKWFATSNLFYVSERKDAVYNATFSSSIKEIQTINSFIDVNLNGGYHFNDKFSAFLNVNNLLNNNYQRFTNFDVQGIQVLGGITYKFDF